MVEKIYKQMLLLAATKNLKWEILTKNLVTFKRWDRGRVDTPMYTMAIK